MVIHWARRNNFGGWGDRVVSYDDFGSRYYGFENFDYGFDSNDYIYVTASISHEGCFGEDHEILSLPGAIWDDFADSPYPALVSTSGRWQHAVHVSAFFEDTSPSQAPYMAQVFSGHLHGAHDNHDLYWQTNYGASTETSFSSAYDLSRSVIFQFSPTSSPTPTATSTPNPAWTATHTGTPTYTPTPTPTATMRPYAPGKYPLLELYPQLLRDTNGVCHVAGWGGVYGGLPNPTWFRALYLLSSDLNDDWGNPQWVFTTNDPQAGVSLFLFAAAEIGPLGSPTPHLGILAADFPDPKPVTPYHSPTPTDTPSAGTPTSTPTPNLTPGILRVYLGPNATPTWTSLTVTDDLLDSVSADMAVDSDGDIHVVWITDDKKDLYYRHAFYSGSTWQWDDRETRVTCDGNRTIECLDISWAPVTNYMLVAYMEKSYVLRGWQYEIKYICGDMD